VAKNPLWLSPRAFTFVELIIALAVASISVVALLRLNIVSIRLTDSARIISQAAFVADRKIAETLALGYPDLGTSAGSLDENGLFFDWQTKVTDDTPPQLADVNVAAVRKISVEVACKQGLSRKKLQMSTYVADRNLQ
jgi:prepilin-type N-terminal cleavage/methylation domain-containing protein